LSKKGIKQELRLKKSVNPWKNIRLLKTIYVIALVVVGTIIGGILTNYNLQISALSLLLKIFTMVLAWKFTVMVNDFFDIEINEMRKKSTILGLSSKSQYFMFLVFFGLSSIFISFLLGRYIFPVLTSLSLIVGVLYSIPPLRIKKYGFKSIFIGFGSVIAFLIGYFDYSNNLTMEIQPKLSLNIIYPLTMLFLAVSLGTNIKGFKEYEEDKKRRVKTLFTIFGLKKGKRIASIFLFFSFLMPILLFPTVTEIILFVSLATIATLIFEKFEDFHPIILLSVFIFIYCALRLTGIF